MLHFAFCLLHCFLLEGAGALHFAFCIAFCLAFCFAFCWRELELCIFHFAQRGSGGSSCDGEFLACDGGLFDRLDFRHLELDSLARSQLLRLDLLGALGVLSGAKPRAVFCLCYYPTRLA